MPWGTGLVSKVYGEGAFTKLSLLPHSRGRDFQFIDAKSSPKKINPNLKELESADLPRLNLTILKGQSGSEGAPPVAMSNYTHDFTHATKY